MIGEIIKMDSFSTKNPFPDGKSMEFSKDGKGSECSFERKMVEKRREKAFFFVFTSLLT